MRCTKCGNELKDGVKFCPKCGTAVPSIKYCENCGSALSPDSSVCPNCGRDYGADDNKINMNDIKTFVLGTDAERQKRNEMIKTQMGRASTAVKGQIDKASIAVKEQKKKWDEEQLRRESEARAREEVAEKVRKEAMEKARRTVMEEEKQRQSAIESGEEVESAHIKASYVPHEDKREQAVYSQAASNYNQSNISKSQGYMNIPIHDYDPSKDYTPISMWGYFGYTLLFYIPIIGIILVIIFSVGGTRNINLRNFARSQFCVFIVMLILVVIMYIASASFLYQLTNMF